MHQTYKKSAKKYLSQFVTTFKNQFVLIVVIAVLLLIPLLADPANHNIAMERQSTLKLTDLPILN